MHDELIQQIIHTQADGLTEYRGRTPAVPVRVLVRLPGENVLQKIQNRLRTTEAKTVTQAVTGKDQAIYRVDQTLMVGAVIEWIIEPAR